jgi:hypothetical protein
LPFFSLREQNGGPHPSRSEQIARSPIAPPGQISQDDQRQEGAQCRRDKTPQARKIYRPHSALRESSALRRNLFPLSRGSYNFLFVAFLIAILHYLLESHRHHNKNRLWIFLRLYQSRAVGIRHGYLNAFIPEHVKNI